MKKFILCFIILSVLAFAGCNQSNEASSQNSDIINITQQELTENGQIESTELTYPGTDFAGEIVDDALLMQEQDVLITQSGAYEFSGEYSSITVNVDKTIDEGAIYIILNGADITSLNGTPINIIEGQDVVIVLQDGTTNTVTQGEIVTTDEDFPSGAIYSKADTVISGGGNLIVSTLYNDAINCRDDLIIEGANITVNAVADGILGKDLLAIKDSTISVTCGKDALKSSNSEDIDRGNIIINSGDFVLYAGNDAISAEQTLQINSGDFEIVTGGGFVEVLNDITRGEGSGGIVQPSSQLEESMKGLKAFNIILNGGTFNISSFEDAVHSDNNLLVNAGTFNIISGDDALHADLDLTINDIALFVEYAYEGIEGSTITINGGDMNVTVLDDAINASSETGYIKITGGTIYLKAQGDGIDSNGDLTVEGGEIVVDVDAVYSGGDSELDVSGVFNISGGTLTDENGNDLELTAQQQSGGGQFQNMRPQRGGTQGSRP